VKYHVAWWDAAFEQMDAVIRANPARKDELAAALRHLAATLANDPDSKGESRAGPDRVEFFGPLTVTFRPVPDDRIVYITSVWLHG
jgi:hypothetical protein